MAQGKKAVRHHVWEDILRLLQGRTLPVSMAHVYGHNKLVYNNDADDLAKARAARSKVHGVSWPGGPAPGGGGGGNRAKAREGARGEKEAVV